MAASYSTWGEADETAGGEDGIGLGEGFCAAAVALSETASSGCAKAAADEALRASEVVVSRGSGFSDTRGLGSAGGGAKEGAGADEDSCCGAERGAGGRAGRGGGNADADCSCPAEAGGGTEDAIGAGGVALALTGKRSIAPQPFVATSITPSTHQNRQAIRHPLAVCELSIKDQFLPRKLGNAQEEDYPCRHGTGVYRLPCVPGPRLPLRPLSRCPYYLHGVRERSLGPSSPRRHRSLPRSALRCLGLS